MIQKGRLVGAPPAQRMPESPVTAHDTLIKGGLIFDGSGGDPFEADVLLADGRIKAVGELTGWSARHVVEAKGKALAPGFIDSHTHDDLYAIRCPEMLPKLSQGVTTVIVGNCGISGAPVNARLEFPEPMNLLGEPGEFRFPAFRKYVGALERAEPALNVAALVGHTALRCNHMDGLGREATSTETEAMRQELVQALAEGALGLSTGLAYMSANSASTEEVVALAGPLGQAGAVYATHMRTETDGILDAMDEALLIGRQAGARVVISHLKCAGLDNWGRSGEVLRRLDSAIELQDVGWDCYPYSASSTTLDLRQVDPRVRTLITWSRPHPEAAGKSLQEIATNWDLTVLEAAMRLMPAGAIYHSMSEEDVRAILRHPATMIGSDGLPNDLWPHPRLWGTFPRVLGRYCRDEGLFSLSVAIRKMSALPAQRFGLSDRGRIEPGCAGDLVLFDPETVCDAATFEAPALPSVGIEAVWVNGGLALRDGRANATRHGTFLRRETA
jgi:N-acyl-D-amino-acid deacylase